MGAPLVLSDYLVGRAEQTTFGTGAADATAAEKLAVDIEFPEIGVNWRKTTGNSAARYADILDIIVNNYGLLPRFTLSGVARMKDIDQHLYSWFQNVVEGDGPLFTKTFTMAAMQPDFAANAGQFVTYWFKSPTASTSLKLIDCVCANLTITCDPGNIMTFSAEYVSRGAVDIDANPSGTWTGIPVNVFDYHKQCKYTANIAGGGANTLGLAGGWSLNFTQDVTGYGQNGTGGHEGYVLNNRVITFTTKGLIGTVEQSLRVALQAGSYVDMFIGWDGDGDDDAAKDAIGDFVFEFQMMQQKQKLTSDVPIGNEITGEIIGTQSSSKAPITVTLLTGADRNW